MPTCDDDGTIFKLTTYVLFIMIRNYPGWHLVLIIILSILCVQCSAFWPFSVHAAKSASESLYPNTNARRIAIIGMS